MTAGDWVSIGVISAFALALNTARFWLPKVWQIKSAPPKLSKELRVDVLAFRYRLQGRPEAHIARMLRTVCSQKMGSL